MQQRKELAEGEIELIIRFKEGENGRADIEIWSSGTSEKQEIYGILAQTSAEVKKDWLEERQMLEEDTWTGFRIVDNIVGAAITFVRKLFNNKKEEDVTPESEEATRREGSQNESGEPN